jgi:DNA-binding transcriptional regulator YiaG
LIERAYRLEDSPGVTAHPISNRVQDCASSAETWWLEQLYRPYLLENPKARPWFEDVIGASARLCEIRALEAKLVDPWQKKILQFSQAKFRRVLEGSGMKQEAFAEAAGVPLETMKSWLKSKKPKKPALETIIEIARRLKISPDEMLEHA